VRVGGRGRRRTVPGGDAAAYVKDQLQRRGEERERSGEPGRVRVAAPAQRVRPRVPGRYATVEPDGADACVVSTRGAWHPGFVVWMASMDEEIEILGPDELREFAHGVSRRLSAAASDAG
jgi:hypothetical protein